ncbi:MAG: hypothetical protein WDZ30_06570 [Cellvibrionaceae bacterium]
MTAITVVLIVLLGLATFRYWELASRLVAESPIADSPYRFFYVSTAPRRLCVMAVYCLIVLAAVGGGALAVYATLWQPVLADFLRDNWLGRSVLLSSTAGAVFLLFALPPLRRVVDTLRYYSLRHLFFPALPSRREEQVIRQLMASKALEFDLEAGAPCHGGAMQTSNALQHRVAELVRLHRKLQNTVGSQDKLGCRLLFGREWEVVDSVYRSVCRQMVSSPQWRRTLPDKIQICLYHSYRLMTAYIFLTGRTRKKQLSKFRWFGYRVTLP